MTEVDLALLAITSIFADDDKESVDRIVRNTREAYYSIVARRKKVALTLDEAPLLDEKTTGSAHG